MKLSILTSLFLTAFLIGSVQSKNCTGGVAASLQDGCKIITGKPLVFEGDVDEGKLGKKFSKVEKIEAGVEVIDTEIVEFSLLRDVEEISNKNGPALLFRGNKKLARIHLPKLRKIEGKTNDVSFDKDNFPMAAYDNQDAMTDLLQIEAAGRVAHTDREVCSTDFLKVTATESSGFGWLFYVLLSANIIAAIILGVQILFLMKQRKAAKTAGGDEPSKEKGGKAKKTKDSDSKDKSADSKTKDTAKDK